MNKPIIITVIAALLAGGAGFVGGMAYKTNQVKPSIFPGNRQGTRIQMGKNNFRPISGEIKSADENTLTVMDQDGSSKIVILSSTTKYSKTETISKSDIQTGDKIGVMGTTNPDGSISAQSIQLNIDKTK